MPLAFRSRSHGAVAFGFFNIEIDMLLLEQHFFFADQFCHAVLDLAAGSVAGDAEIEMEGWIIRDPSEVGNVNDAIREEDLTGFIGETYRKFPFPKDPEGFKQKPYGERNRSWARERITRFGEPQSIRLRYEAKTGCVSISGFVFDREGFAALVLYVDRGGYPRWENGVRPAFVQLMMEKLSGQPTPLFSGLLGP